MPNRWRDWWRQAERDLEHARKDLETGFHEHACFGSQQCSEKALKALVMHVRGEPWGHSLVRLVDALGDRTPGGEGLKDSARELDKLYIPARYPNGFSEGAPVDYFTEANAREALRHAEYVLDYVRGQIREH